MRRNGKSPLLDLNLNLSPPAKSGPRGEEGSQQRRSSTSSSSPSSCVSSEAEDGGAHSPEVTSMVLAACPRCLMYVMLAEGDPKCPKCHNAVILDFLHDTTNTKTRES